MRYEKGESLSLGESDPAANYLQNRFLPVVKDGDLLPSRVPARWLNDGRTGGRIDTPTQTTHRFLPSFPPSFNRRRWREPLQTTEGPAEQLSSLPSRRRHGGGEGEEEPREDEGTCALLRVRACADTHAREGIEEQVLGIPNVEEDITRRDNISW